MGRGSSPSAASAIESTPRQRERPLGDRDCRLAGGIMGLIGAAHPAAARISPGKRIEMEPCLGTGVTHRLEATAALGARDRRTTTVANCDEGADLGLRGVDHLGSRLSDQSGGPGASWGGNTRPRCSETLGGEGLAGRRRRGSGRVAIRLRDRALKRPPRPHLFGVGPSTINHPERTSRRMSDRAVRTTMSAPSRLWGSNHVSAAASAHRRTVPFQARAIRSRVLDCRRSRVAARLVRPGCDRRP